MRKWITGSVIFAAVVAFSLAGMVAQGRQNGQGQAGANNTGRSGNPLPVRKFDTLGNDPGGPAPKKSITGAWAGPQEPKIAKAPSLTPLGQKMFAMHHTEAKYSAAGTNDPWYNTCDPMGFPRSSINETRAIMFSETPDRVVETYQYSRLWREIMTDGRPLPTNVGKPNGQDPRWYGYSVGHWEGDNTFVVDTTGSDERSWLDKEGDPHSVNAVTHETYERTSHNLMTNKITITDPEVYTAPFPITTVLYKWIPDQQFEEQICVPSEMIAYRSLIGNPAGDGGVQAHK
jgi:hypothetical protein